MGAKGCLKLTLQARRWGSWCWDGGVRGRMCGVRPDLPNAAGRMNVRYLRISNLASGFWCESLEPVLQHGFEQSRTFPTQRMPRSIE